MVYERIEKSLNRAIRLHNSGLSANESVVKAARESELNPETISRVVEAFNIAKTKAYVKLAQDKTADFDIADKKEVIKAVFAGEPTSKTASEEIPALSDVFGLEIAATEPREEFVACRTSEIPLESKIKMAFQAIEEQNRELSEKRHEIVAAKEDFYEGLKAASEVLDSSYERDAVGEYAAGIFYQHSDNPRAGKILSLVCKCAGVDLSGQEDKVGGAQDYEPCPFFEAFEKAVEADSRYSFLAGEYNKSVREVSEKQAELKGLVYKSGNVAEDKSASDLLWGNPKKAKKSSAFSEFPEDLLEDVLGSLFDESPKTAFEAAPAKAASMLKVSGISDMVAEPGRVMSSLTEFMPSSGKPVQELADKGYITQLQGKSPVQEQKAKNEIDNAKREAIFRELLNDDIIAQQDPQEVAGAYNTMMRLAPQASLIKDIAKSVLRQGTAQVIDPHFANTLVELENNIMKAQAMASGKIEK